MYVVWKVQSGLTNLSGEPRDCSRLSQGRGRCQGKQLVALRGAQHVAERLCCREAMRALQIWRWRSTSSNVRPGVTAKL